MTNPNTNQNLRELLERLHNELEQTDSIDEDGTELLRHLASDIRRRLEQTGTKRAPEPDDPILERLQGTIDHFEATHPSLTLTLSEMMTILSNAGI
jgi:hypothetical protein